MTMGDPNAAFDRLDANKDDAISRENSARGVKNGSSAASSDMKRPRKAPKDGKEVRRHVMRMAWPGMLSGR